MSLEQDFLQWLESITENEQVNENIKGFNFGLTETDKQFVMYVTGSENFDAEEGDWATDVDFQPSNKYFGLGTEFSKGKAWGEVLGFVEELLSDYVRTPAFKTSFLKDAEGITIGFDDGDLHVIYLKD